MLKLFRRFLLAFALVAAAYAGFRWGPAVFPRVEGMLGLGTDSGTVAAAEPVPSPEMAEATLDRFEDFRAGESGSRLELGGIELTSVVRYALPGLLPAGVTEPEVELDQGKMLVSAWVAREAFPRLPSLDRVVGGFLPDTLYVDMRGSLVPLDQRNLALVVDRVRIHSARIPVPSGMIGSVLEGLRGNRGGPTLPPDALPVPLPDGLESAFVERDKLVLVAEGGG